MVCEKTRSRRIAGGFSLIEVALAGALGALLYTMAVPQMQDWLAARKLANRAYALEQTLNLARSEALKRSARVDVCPSDDGFHCSSEPDWSRAWIVFVDDNDDGDPVDAAAIIRREPPLGEGVAITANQPVEAYVSFTALGHARKFNGALQMGSFALCKTAQNRLLVVLANSGRARIETSPARCP